MNNAVYKNRAQGCCVAKFIVKTSRKCLIREAIKRIDFEISMASRGNMPLQIGKSVTQLLLSASPSLLRCGWTPPEESAVFRLEQTAVRSCNCGGAGEQLLAAGYVFTYRFTN